MLTPISINTFFVVNKVGVINEFSRIEFIL